VILIKKEATPKGNSSVIKSTTRRTPSQSDILYPSSLFIEPVLPHEHVPNPVQKKKLQSPTFKNYCPPHVPKSIRKKSVTEGQNPEPKSNLLRKVAVEKCFEALSDRFCGVLIT